SARTRAGTTVAASERFSPRNLTARSRSAASAERSCSIRSEVDGPPQPHSSSTATTAPRVRTTSPPSVRAAVDHLAAAAGGQGVVDVLGDAVADHADRTVAEQELDAGAVTAGPGVGV